MARHAKIIGLRTSYHGVEHPYLHGYEVRIVAVLKTTGGPEYERLTDDQDIARAGGVTSGDHIEVQPWLEGQGRFSFVTSDPRAIDLAAFAHLRQRGPQPDTAQPQPATRPPHKERRERSR